jgi:hypothetical protein
MDTHSTPNNKIRKARVRIVVYILMLVMLRPKTKICTMVKYKRSRSLTFTVSRFLFSVTIGLMQSRVLVQDKYGFISIDLNHQGYKSESFMLAKHIAQVFYVPDTTNKRLKVVIPGKRRIIGVENAVDEEESDHFDEIPPFVTLMIKPRILSANEAPYLCNNHHEKVRNFKKPRPQRNVAK